MMSISQWFRKLYARKSAGFPKKQHYARPRRAPIRLRLEELEERSVPSVVQPVSIRYAPVITAGGYIGEHGISDNGDFVVFESSSSGVVLNDTNGTTDVFLYDRVAGTTSLISRNSAGFSGNSWSGTASISGDGNFIVFNSAASDLVSSDSNGAINDVFVYDRTAGTMALVSRNSAGTGSGNNNSYNPVLSDNGGFIAFESDASNLVAGDTNNQRDIFLFDRTAGTVSLVSRNSTGTGSGAGWSGGPVISGDGSIVAFPSDATDLVSGDDNFNSDVFVYNRTAGAVALVSRNSDGTGSGNRWANDPVVSHDGNLIAFTSASSNLVSNDTNGFTQDVFVYFTPLGLVDLVSRNSAGTGSGNSDSYSPSISGDGKFITFQSYASDLVSGDGNNRYDIFLFDRDADAVSLVSHNNGGSGSGNNDSYEPAISDDGGYIIFDSYASDLVNNDTNGGNRDVFVYDRTAGTTSLVSRNSAGTGSGNNYSYGRAISGDGSFVGFRSDATNLVANDDSVYTDAFLFDRNAGTNVLVSQRSTPGVGTGTSTYYYANGSYVSNVQSVSDNGQYVVYTSQQTDLVSNDTNGYYQDVFLFDRVAGTTALVSRNSAGTGSGNYDSYNPVISGDGAYIAFTSSASDLVSNDTNGTTQDVFVYNRTAGTIALVSRNSAGSGSGNSSSFSPVISDDGGHIAFYSNANNLVSNDTGYQDIFVYDRTAGTVALVSRNSAGTGNGNNHSYNPAISGDGAYIAFTSSASNLVSNDTNGTNEDVFVYDRVAGTVALVSRNSAGTGSGNNFSSGPVISDNGGFISFYSQASDLVSNDTNGTTQDVFVYNRTAGTVALVSRNSAGTGSGSNTSNSPVISGNGAYIAFTSNASNLVSNDSNGTTQDVFLYDRVAGTMALVSRNSAGTGSGGSSSYSPVINDDGSYIAFVSQASNLISNDINGSTQDVFVFDRTAGAIALVSGNLTGTGSGNDYSDTPAISSDGSFIAFNSAAGNLTEPDLNTGNYYWRRDVFLFRNKALQVTSTEVATPDPRNTPVSTLDVVLSRAANIGTFNYTDLSLTRNGGANLIDNTVTVTFEGGTTYRIHGLGAFTTSDGTYVLKVNAATMDDMAGNPGDGYRTETWIMDTAAPTITSVVPVSPDPRNAAVNAIYVYFSEQVDLSTFDYNDVHLTLNGGGELIDNTVTVTRVLGSVYEIGNLAGKTAAEGNYVLTIDATGVKDKAGNNGTGSAGDSWSMDTTAPTITAVGPVTPDPRNTSVATVDVTFSTTIDLSTFDYNDLTLTRDAGPNVINSSVGIAFLSGTTYRISGLSGLTGTDGAYLLTVNGAGVKDAAGNSGTNSLSDGWVKDTVAPTITSVGPVTPDPRNTAVASVNVQMSELVNLATFDFNDLSLTRLGGPNLIVDNSVTVTYVSGTTYSINGLIGLTTPDGIYVLTVNGAGIQDLAGNSATNNVSDDWLMNTAGPTVSSVGPVTPDPRNNAVSTVDVVLSVPINLSSFDVNDISLTRNSSPVSLNGTVTVTFVSGTTYRINNLTGFTGLDGTYVLTVDASGIQDSLANNGTGTGSDTWLKETTGPTVTAVGPVTPDPRNTAVSFVNVTLSEPINLSTFDNADVTLTLDGGGNLIDSGVTVTFVSGTTYRINNLASLTGNVGTYLLTVSAAGIQDLAGNSGSGSLSDTWSYVINPPPAVPTANGDVASVPEDSAATAINVLANDSGSGLTIVAVTQGLSGSVVITGGGTGLTYQPIAGFTGVDSFTYTIEDTDGDQSTAMVIVAITPVNDAPVLAAPVAATIVANQPIVLNGITVNDIDAGTNLMQASVSALVGTLTLGSTAGLNFTVGDGTADSAMTFTGTLASINGALAGLIYSQPMDACAADTVSILVSDLGSTGSGGVLTDSASIAISPNYGGAQMVPDPFKPGTTALVINGTTAVDAISVSRVGTSTTTFLVTINGETVQTFSGVTGRILVFGFDGDDTISVAATVVKQTWLSGGDGHDSISGGGGIDWISGGDGNDTLKGGAGVDRLVETADVNFVLIGGTTLLDGSLAGLGTDRLYRNTIETAHLTGGVSDNTFNTSLFGGKVTLNGGAGNDTLTSGKGSDSLNGGDGADTINVSLGNDIFNGGGGDDTLVGRNAATLWSITTNNGGRVGTSTFVSVENLQGGTLGDTFKFSNGKSVSGVIDGGSGTNKLDYTLYLTAVNVNLLLDTATGTAGVSNISNVAGGAANDILVGNAAINTLVGNGGRDVLIGGGSADVLNGGAGDDLLVSGATDHDTTPSSLDAIMVEWAQATLYATRISNLSALLNAGTITDDSGADKFTGGTGLDWFLASLGDTIADKSAAETKTVV